jgi:hypothetical protein
MKKQIKDLQLYEIDFLIAKIEKKDDAYIFHSTCYIENNYIFSPTTNPLQTWPIIDRDMISTIYIDYYTKWMAESEKCSGFGETSLEAAMRCFVASKFGDEVEL